MQDIEDTLHERLDDRAARMVYAEALQSRGDPLGEQLVLSEKAAAQGASSDDKARAKAWYEGHRAELLGAFDADSPAVHLTWERGLITQAWFRPQEARKVHHQILALREAPVARFLQALELNVSATPQLHGPTPWRSLRRLQVYLPPEVRLDLVNLSEWAPRIAELHANMGSVEVGDRAPQSLSRLSLYVDAVQPRISAERPGFLGLEQMRIHLFRRQGDQGAGLIDWLRCPFPALRDLHLDGEGATAAIKDQIRALPTMRAVQISGPQGS